MGLPAVKLDTLSIAKELEDSGMPKSQAEFQVRATVKAINMVIEEKMVILATKQDIVESEEKLSGVIHELDKRLTSAVHELDKRLTSAIHELDKRIDKLDKHIDQLGLTLTVRLGGMIAAGMLILGAIIKF
jgi:hypothetical protein